MNKSHALVIGGSGMLKKASLWLAGQGHDVSVIGRNKSRLQTLVDENSRIHPLPLDYYNFEEFKKAIHSSMVNHGVYKKVVAWIHDREEEILNIIRSEIESVSNDTWELFHVLGSSADVDEIKRKLSPIDNCNYYQIQLGFKMENGRSRWLTHDEISDGVIECITNKRNILVGQLEPWELRP